MNYTLTHNATYKSLEISFTEKPSDTVREALKALKSVGTIRKKFGTAEPKKKHY